VQQIQESDYLVFKASGIAAVIFQMYEIGG
jgi:hypothetical protein